MPKHRYNGDPRYYPHLGLHVEDGDVHNLPEAPDHRWEPEPEPIRRAKPETTKE
jgi:hypothetical protein